MAYTEESAARIRERILKGILANRVPGFHYPGHFLDIRWPSIDGHRVVEAMEPGEHCLNTDGTVNLAALGVMVDTALATAPRLAIAPGERQATVFMNLQLTGAALRGPLSMTADLETFSAVDTVRHAVTRGVLTCSGQTIGYATATFVVLPPPKGVTMSPLPWQRDAASSDPALYPPAPGEDTILRACKRALAKADDRHSFIEHFWGVMPKAGTDSAICRVKIGPHLGNRVGHMQGGLMLGLGAITAGAAVPRHPMLSNVSAWYISPGHGGTVVARSKIVHAGRSFAVVKTDLKSSDGTLICTLMTNHAARLPAHA